jgi:hypothetical protein
MKLSAKLLDVHSSEVAVMNVFYFLISYICHVFMSFNAGAKQVESENKTPC